MKSKKLLSLLLALCLVIALVPVTAGAAEEEFDTVRLAGDNRFETSLMVADLMKENLGVDKFDAIIIASGNDFADALAGSYLATVKDAPILLSWGKGGRYSYLDTDNIEYIKKNLSDNGTVYILGGEKAVPNSYETALKSYYVKRLGGANRFETNIMILKEAGVRKNDEILVCTSTNFADSLSASATGNPILLVWNEGGKLFDVQKTYLSTLKNNTFTVIGGTSAVSDKLIKVIKGYGTTTRLAGKDRFETSVLVAKRYFDDPESAVLAYARNYPDGLCGGALAYSMDAPLILTMTKYEDQADAYIDARGIKMGVVLGGTGLISSDSVDDIFTPPDILKVAAIETAYGTQVWAAVAAAFEAETGIQVELTTSKNLEDVLAAPMQSGEYPDVVHLATGRPAGLTEQLVKANALHPLTNMLGTTIPGESATPADKIAGGFTDNNTVAPYGDGVTYMAPMFYSPCGLFYNAKLFEEKGWTVPTTWDEMWTLGDKAMKEGIYLFTYPTAGYYDAFMFALMNAIGGPEFFNAITTYEEGAWDSENGQKLLAILDKLAKYTHPDTPAQANNQDFTKNQAMAMNGSALFMPNGTWITGEMASYAEILDNFAWGMTAVPSAGEAPYAFCWFEQAWIPAGAGNIEAAEQFVAFLYSDKAAEIFASAGAIQPILGVADMLEGENVMFYSIYDNGAKAAMGGFAAFKGITGLYVADTFFAPIDSLVAGTMTIEQYADLVKTNSALMRENLIE